MSHETPTAPEPTPRTETPAASPPPVIAISGLSKRYDSGFSALKQIDLEIQRGVGSGAVGVS